MTFNVRVLQVVSRDLSIQVEGLSEETVHGLSKVVGSSVEEWCCNRNLSTLHLSAMRTALSLAEDPSSVWGCVPLWFLDNGPKDAVAVHLFPQVEFPSRLLRP